MRKEVTVAGKETNVTSKRGGNMSWTRKQEEPRKDPKHVLSQNMSIYKPAKKAKRERSGKMGTAKRRVLNKSPRMGDETPA